MHISGLGLEEPFLCLFPLKSRSNVKYGNTLLTWICFVSFLFNFLKKFSSTNVSKIGDICLGGKSSDGSVLSVHSHVFRCTCSCFSMEDNGTRIGTDIRGSWCRRDDSIGSDWFLLPMHGGDWAGRAAVMWLIGRLHGRRKEESIFALAESHFEKDAAFQDLFIWLAIMS